MRQRLNALPLEDQWTLLFLTLAVLLGGAVRFLPSIQAGFPINDGGMFYVMTKELVANSFALPHLTGYNGLNIPYAYPPLGFYAAGLAAALSGADLLDIFRFLPAAITTLCIPLVYRFARDLLGERPLAALAALIYALLPRSYIFLIMGGGITRAWGHLFMLLTVWMALRAFTHPQRRWVALAGLSGALTALSHPEAAMHAAAFGLVLWLFYGRSRTGAQTALSIAALTALLSLPWWGLMLSRHGLDPYLAAFGTGRHNLWSPFLFSLTNFTEEAFLTLLATLSLVGIFLEAKSRRFVLVGFMMSILAISPRSATAPLMIPVAFLAALTLHSLILPSLSSTNSQNAWMQPGQRLAGGFLGFVAVYAFFGAAYLSIKLTSGFVLLPAQREGLRQLSQVVSPGQPVLVLTGSAMWEYDQTTEWLPALTGAVSINTVQGREWLLGRKFYAFGQSINDMQRTCPYGDMNCLARYLDNPNLLPLADQSNDSLLVYVDKTALAANLDLPNPALITHLPLVQALRQSPSFDFLGENDEFILFRRK